MSGMEDVYDRRSRVRVTARAVLRLAAGLAAAVGSAAAAASLVAGFGLARSMAFRVAVVLGGLVPVAGFLVPVVRTRSLERTSTLGALGAAVAVAGLGLFWVAFPAGWAGDLGSLPLVAVGAYAVGLLAVFGASVSVETDGTDEPTEESDRLGAISSAVTVRTDARGDRSEDARSDRDGGGERADRSVVGDGGTDEDGLSFLGGNEGS